MKILTNIVNKRLTVFDIFHAVVMKLGTVSKFRALFQAAESTISQKLCLLVFLLKDCITRFSLRNLKYLQTTNCCTENCSFSTQFSSFQKIAG